MAERVTSHRWQFRLLFAALAFAVIFTRLLPIDAGPGRLPGPDVMFLIAIAWVLRRPAYVPVALVAAVFLMMDVLFLRPLGLWAACVVVAIEVFRTREAQWRDLPFLLEWMLVGFVIAATSIAYIAILTLFAADQPSFGLTLLQMLITILCYPLAVFFSVAFLGLRKVVPGAVDQLGRRV
ncbi:MAG: rod shape-determining protein MreD [Pseudomonadota bacterium]